MFTSIVKPRFFTPSPKRFVAVALIAAAIGAVTATTAHAQTPTQRIEQRVDNRQDRQEQRIEQGVASGALTPQETRRLGREQAGVVRAEARAEADGKITRREAVNLERRQDRASRDIRRQKHDRQVRTR